MYSRDLYGVRVAASDGIYRSTLDTAKRGSFPPPVSGPSRRVNPSFLEIASKRQASYTPSVRAAGAGTVMACAIDAETGGLTLLNTAAVAQGSGPCHVSTSITPERTCSWPTTVAAVPRYFRSSPTVASSRQGHRLPSSTPVPASTRSRQQEPHAHSINVSADDRFAFVADLGIDKIMIYKLDVEAGTLTPNDPAFVEVKPGAGRGISRSHPTGRYAYVINELNDTVTAFGYYRTLGTLAEIQTVPTLPSDFEGQSTCAEIRVHPNGRFLYGSNRGHDSIVVYQIDPATGKLTLVEYETADIKTPRNFNIDPTGTFCLVANMDGASVVVFRIDGRPALWSPPATRSP